MRTTLIMLTSLTLSTTITNITNFNNSKNDTKINQLYVLGDSLSDSNNLANILSSETWNLHDVSFKSPFYDNSFTNGDTAAKILAKKLNITLTPAWETQTIGNNYAVAGARATKFSWWSFEGWILNRATIEKQADKLIKEHTIKSNDEVFLEIGGNDLVAALELKNSNEQEELINTAVTNEINAVQNLINHGANHLIISNAPNISYIPRFNQSSQKSQADKLSIEFNSLWKKQITQLINKNSKVNLVPFDLATTFSNVLEQAAQLGKNTIQASINYSILGLYFNKKPEYINNTTPETINNNFFFDDIHPNKWGHQQIANAMYKLVIN